jgi:hypothetical protein
MYLKAEMQIRVQIILHLTYTPVLIRALLATTLWGWVVVV